jgi:hypothetical protein
VSQRSTASNTPAINGVKIAVSHDGDLPMTLLSRDEFGVELDEFA